MEVYIKKVRQTSNTQKHTNNKLTHGLKILTDAVTKTPK
jgi:hypothetical protein